MFATLFDRPARNSSYDEVENPIDDLDEEDGYDRFSKKTKYEAKADYDAYAGVDSNDEVDVEDFYDRDWSME